MEEKKKKQINKKTWITAGLRRMSYRWTPRNEALKLARVERGLYKCAMCESSFKQNEVVIDHIEPVVSIKDGFTNWEDFINRLFCDVEGFQILCYPCHDQKTNIEDSLRAEYNAERKRIEKEKKKEQKRLAKLKKE